MCSRLKFGRESEPFQTFGVWRPSNFVADLVDGFVEPDMVPIGFQLLGDRVVDACFKKLFTEFHHVVDVHLLPVGWVDGDRSDHCPW